MSEEALLGGVGGFVAGYVIGSHRAQAQAAQPQPQMMAPVVYVESWDFLASGYLDVGSTPTQLLAPQGTRAFLLRSPNTNTATIWLGDATVAKGKGLPIYAGESLMIAVRNPASIYFVADEGVQRIYLLFVGARA